MDEEYLDNLYNWISSVDDTFKKRFTPEDWVNRLNTDTGYANKLYDWISSVDRSFAKRHPKEEWKTKVGVNTDPEITVSSVTHKDDLSWYQDKYKKGDMSKQEYLMIEQNLQNLQPDEVIHGESTEAEIKAKSTFKIEEKAKKDKAIKDWEEKEVDKYEKYVLENNLTETLESDDLTRESRDELYESIIKQAGFSEDLAKDLRGYTTEKLYDISEEVDSPLEKMTKQTLEALGITEEQLKWMKNQENTNWMTKSVEKDAFDPLHESAYETVATGKFKELFGQSSSLQDTKNMKVKWAILNAGIDKYSLDLAKLSVEESAIFKEKETEKVKANSNDKIINANPEEKDYSELFRDMEEVKKAVGGDISIKDEEEFLKTITNPLAKAFYLDVKKKLNDRKEKEKKDKPSEIELIWKSDVRGDVEDFVDKLMKQREDRFSGEYDLVGGKTIKSNERLLDDILYPNENNNNWKTKDEMVDAIIDFEYKRHYSPLHADLVKALITKEEMGYGWMSDESAYAEDIPLPEKDMNLLSLIGENEARILANLYGDLKHFGLEPLFDSKETLSIPKGFDKLFEEKKYNFDITDPIFDDIREMYGFKDNIEDNEKIVQIVKELNIIQDIGSDREVNEK